jgi:hypothetical protein
MSWQLKNAVRFGKLNLILCESDTEYAVWRTGTAALVRLKCKGKPQDKEAAKQLLDTIREMVGIQDKGDSR